jgi:hypothetical protein
MVYSNYEAFSDVLPCHQSFDSKSFLIVLHLATVDYVPCSIYPIVTDWLH